MDRGASRPVTVRAEAATPSLGNVAVRQALTDQTVVSVSMDELTDRQTNLRDI